MSMKKCKECGNMVSTRADVCPSCGLKVKSKPIGCVTVIVILVILGVTWSKIDGCLDKRAEQARMEKGRVVAAELAAKKKAEFEKEEIKRKESDSKEKAEFEKNIEQHYQSIVSYYKKDSLSEARNEISLFEKYNKSDYKDVSNFSRKLTIMDLEQEVAGIPASQVQKNLDIYKKLDSLDPGNMLYNRKIAFYQIKVDILKEEEKRKKQEYQKEKRKKEQEYRKLVQRFGEKPVNSGWDGSVRCVKDYMEKAAKDPDSLKFEKWGEVSFNSDAGWLVWCQYRAKNSFGGYVRELKWFVIRHNMVVDVKPPEAYKF